MNNLTTCNDTDSPMTDRYNVALNGDNESGENDSGCLYTRYQNDYRLSDDQQCPSSFEFEEIIQQYLNNLSDKKRDKALVDIQRYNLILQVLKDPKNTAISTAQFRFWVKKMFQLLVINSVECVIHDDKPVAIREKIYEILVLAHSEAHHGGRDKTSALVRKRYSWIPKELIAKFVRHCPFCISRRNGCLSPGKTEAEPRTPSSNDASSFDPTLLGSFDSYTAASAAAAAVAAAASKTSDMRKIHKGLPRQPQESMLQDDFNFTCYRPSISMAATVATSAAAAAVASTAIPSPFSRSNFDFYYPRPSEWKENKLPSPKPDKVLDLGMPDFSEPKYYSIKSNVASVAEFAAIAAVYKPYQPSSPDLTDSSASSVSSCSDILPTAYSMI